MNIQKEQISIAVQVKLIIKDSPLVLDILRSSVDIENKDIFLTFNEREVNNTNSKLRLVQEYRIADSHLEYNIGPHRINTILNTCDDLLEHLSLAAEIQSIIGEFAEKID
jgi:hypothetical protein